MKESSISKCVGILPPIRSMRHIGLISQDAIGHMGLCGFNLQVQQWNHFAPEERDVYSPRAHAQGFRSGAKPGSERLPRQAQAIALLRSFGVRKGSPSYKHLAPLGRNDKQCSVVLP